MQPHALLLPGIEDLTKSLDEVCLFSDGVLIKGTLGLIFFKLVLDGGGVVNLGDKVLKFNDFGFFALKLVYFVLQLQLELSQFFFLLELL